MSRCRSSMPRALLCVCFAAASIRTASAAAPWFDDDGDLGDAKAEANNNNNNNAPLPGENAALAEATVSAIASSHSTDWMANLSSPIDFEARDGQLFANGEPFYVKGANWFGSEGRTGPPGGLSAHTVGWYLDFLSANGFNAIRLLFNHESILGDGRISAAELSKAPELYGLSYLQMFRSIALQAGQRGIVVMMACHRLTPTAWPGSGLWFDEQIDEARVLESWDKIASTLCDVRVDHPQRLSLLHLSIASLSYTPTRCPLHSLLAMTLVSLYIGCLAARARVYMFGYRCGPSSPWTSRTSRTPPRGASAAGPIGTARRRGWATTCSRRARDGW